PNDPPPPRLPVVGVGLATLLSVTTGLLIALRQLDGLVGQVLDGGLSRTPTGLAGPRLPWADPEGWRFLFGEGLRQEGGLGGWLTGYAVLDVLF
ncbi:hypothetical protein OVW19_27680, partial [Klebsiella pneumoniae]|uniref:hypothetical protein n=1 Tax=Klebsiella pneumoniae TaxID=573 RepID=UPI0022708C79